MKIKWKRKKIRRAHATRAGCGTCAYLNRSKKDEPCCRCDVLRNLGQMSLFEIAKAAEERL